MEQIERLIVGFTSLPTFGKAMLSVSSFLLGMYLFKCSLGAIERLASAMAKIVESAQKLLIAFGCVIFVVTMIYFASDKNVKGIAATKTDNAVTVQIQEQ